MNEYLVLPLFLVAGAVLTGPALARSDRDEGPTGVATAVSGGEGS